MIWKFQAFFWLHVGQRALSSNFSPQILIPDCWIFSFLCFQTYPWRHGWLAASLFCLQLQYFPALCPDLMITAVMNCIAKNFSWFINSCWSCSDFSPLSKQHILSSQVMFIKYTQKHLESSSRSEAVNKKEIIFAGSLWSQSAQMSLG